MTAAFRDSELLIGQLDGVKYFREQESDPYVEIPPARLITDKQGGTWSFGTVYRFDRNGYYEFNVIRNDLDLDEYAQKIVYRGGKVRIFGQDGWRVWNGRSFI